MKTAFIFDMDGLLIDSEPLWRQASLDVLNEYGVPVTLEDLFMWTGIPIPGIVANACRLYQKEPDQAALSAHLLEHAMRMIIQARPLMPGVKQSLALLRSKDVKMAIASASPMPFLEELVESCGIAKYFQAISSAHDLPYNKPHPGVYLQALNMLGVQPHEAVGLEDSRVGMIAVKAANMTAIVIPNEETRNDAYWALADYKIGSLFDLNDSLLATL